MTDSETKDNQKSINSTGMYMRGSIPPEAPSGSLSFDTNVVDIATLKQQAKALRDSPDAPTGAFTLEVKKRKDSIWSGWISIGRAKNNDMVISHSTISKLHARIQKQTDNEGNIRYILTDANSSAGTVVNGNALRKGEKHKLNTGDKVFFGHVGCVFLDHTEIE